jgi:WD40 repeat protein
LLDPQVSADGTQVVAPGRSGRIRFYDLVDGKAVLRWAFPNKSRDYPGVDFLPPGDRLLVLERGSNYMRRARGWRQWLVLRSTADGKKVGEWDIGTRSTLPDHFLISPDGSTLVMVHGHELELWDTGDLERPLRRVRPASRSQILRAAFHPSGDVLMTVGNQPVVRFWDARTWAEARTFAWDLGKLQSVAFSPDGSMAAVGAVTGRVLVWDVDL